MMLKRLAAALLAAVCLPWTAQAEEADLMKYSLSAYESRVKAAWLGKMVGVCTGRLNEFYHKDELVGPEDVPQWHPSLLELSLLEDDVYVPVAILQVLDRQGRDISGADMAVALYPYSFEFWNSHYAAFEAGYAPPYAGHPDVAPLPDALSYAFAADYSGLIAPCNPNVAIELADRFGSALVYGDGIYGGAFLGAMYAQAFVEGDMEQLLRHGLAAIPADSLLHQSVNQVLEDWHSGLSFEDCWEHIEQRYFRDPKMNWIEWPWGGRIAGIDLDVKLNSAYVAMAMLYGERDIEKTLELALRCGQDTDSNAANALGVLFCTLGWENVPEVYRHALRDSWRFAYVGESLDSLTELTVRVALQAIPTARENGETVLLLEPQAAHPADHAQNSRFPEPMEPAYMTAEQMAAMVKPSLQDGDFSADWHDVIYPPWIVTGDRRGAAGIDLRKGTAARGQNNAWLCPVRGGETGLSQRRIAVEPGCTYTLRFAYALSGPEVQLRLEIRDSSDKNALLWQENLSGTSKYSWKELTFTADTAQAIDLCITACAETDRTWARLDAFSLEKAPT